MCTIRKRYSKTVTISLASIFVSDNKAETFQVSVATQLPKEPDGRRLAPTCFSDFNYLTGECYPADRRQLP